jgi:hypothetical protein
MLPADDQVATGGIVAVVAEFSALALQFDPHQLPAILPRMDAALRIAIRISMADIISAMRIAACV